MAKSADSVPLELGYVLNERTYPGESEDDASVFEFTGERGDGTTSRLCSHCKWMLENWAEHENDLLNNQRWNQYSEPYRFPHYENIFQLKDSAIDCSLCYQFWRSGVHELQDARVAAKMRRGGYKGIGVRVFESHTSQKTNLSLRLDFVWDGHSGTADQINKVNVESNDRKLDKVSFNAVFFPAAYSGKARLRDKCMKSSCADM
jgi:hypothetical protein